MRSLLPFLVPLVMLAAACGAVFEGAMAPTEEERAALAARCAGFRSVLDVVEAALDPIPTLRILMDERDPTAWEVIVDFAIREERRGLERAQVHITSAAGRDSASHRLAYDALERSVTVYLDISARAQLGETDARLQPDVARANAELYESARQHEASCGPPAGRLGERPDRSAVQEISPARQPWG